jgi:anaerobic ribonucleoside-triphosphate reductase activating protein
VLKFVQRVREEVPNTSIWLYTGYTYEDIRCGGVGICAQLMMEYLDVLVDGPFIQEKKDISLLFRGSSNQRLIDMKKTKWGTGDGTIYLWHD